MEELSRKGRRSSMKYFVLNSKRISPDQQNHITMTFSKRINQTSKDSTKEKKSLVNHQVSQHYNDDK